MAHQNLGNLLRAWRQKRDLTLAQFAAEIGISVTILHKLETGKGCTGNTFRLVMDWMQL